MILAVPKYGRVKANKILNQCRISPSKTIGGLSERQRAELVHSCAASAAVRSFSRPSRRSCSLRRGQGLRDHRPVRGRQGHADRAAAASACPSSSSRSRRRRARRGPGRSTAATTTSSTADEFERRVEASDFLEHADLQRQPLRDAALGGRARGWPRARSVVLEIEVQGARQVRAAMPEAVLVFIAPPDPRRCASGSRAAAPTRRGDRGAPADRRDRARGAGGVPARGRERRPAEGGRGAGEARPRRAIPTLTPMHDQATSRQTARAHRLPLRGRAGRRQARPPAQQLLPRARRGRYEEYTPPMVEPSGNYLTIALEERLRARSSTSTGPSAPRRRADGPHPARGQRRHRRLQGARVRAPRDQGRTRAAGR